MRGESRFATLQNDLNRSSRRLVLYLEGKDDIDAFFALMGHASLPDRVSDGYVWDGVFVKAASGRSEVESLVAESRNRLKGIFGVVDGDGRALHDLQNQFDPPYPGPLFAWKSYSIENLIARTGWPAGWGVAPDWKRELVTYAPHVALNQIHVEVRDILRNLGIEKYSNLPKSSVLKTSDEVLAVFDAVKHQLAGYEVEPEYLGKVAEFRAVLGRSLDEAHALLNGKWLVEHFAPMWANRDASTCRAEWLAHARASGGLPEVREWWERITGPTIDLA